MRKDNPAVYDCPKAEVGKLHYWIDLRIPRGAICLNCGLRLNEADARDIGFTFK